MSHRVAIGQFYGGIFSVESLFPHDFSLCRIDRKKKKNLAHKIDFLSTWHTSSSLSNYNFPFLFISKIFY